MSNDEAFYGAVLAEIHDAHFGALARGAADLVVDLLRERGIERGTVVDLGCGSGITAAALTDAGFDVVGIDVSPAMLDIARRRVPQASFRCEPVLDATIPDAVAVTAIGEVLSYAADARMLRADPVPLFSRVRAALAPKGVFVFDVASSGRAGPTGVRDAVHEGDDWTIAMRAAESADRMRLDRHITIFRKADGDCFGCLREHHVLRLLEPGDVTAALHAAGFAAARRDGYGAVADELLPGSTMGWSVFVATVPSR
ncbi:MAG TPA: class I SAM-dependent methyltransferase [Acidimicrobiales bacterium]